jgi:cell division protein FtsL
MEQIKALRETYAMEISLLRRRIREQEKEIEELNKEIRKLKEK